MWYIDQDVTAEPGSQPGTNENAMSMHSKDWNEAKAKQVGTVRFRMLDDDGDVYYYGVMTQDACFDPLDDFGAPNAGCTSIELFTDFSSGGTKLPAPKWMPL